MKRLQRKCTFLQGNQKYRLSLEEFIVFKLQHMFMINLNPREQSKGRRCTINGFNVYKN